MSKISLLLDEYGRHVRLPWQDGLSGREKVWFCIYDPPEERRLRMRIPEFEVVSRESGHGWHATFDIAGRFEEWFAQHKYRESYFHKPSLLTSTLATFGERLVGDLSGQLAASDPNAVVGVLGAGTLFGLPELSVSRLVDGVTPSIRGRLVVFFPGTRDDSNNYRLLDARDGSNYLAVPIEVKER